MDKWKDIELEKMKVGGNRNAREFLENHPDWNDRAPISQKYNSKAAALYRDKISTLAQGQSWDMKEAEKRIGKTNSSYGSSNASSLHQSKSSGSLSSGQNYNSNINTGGYQNGGGYSDNSYQQFSTQEFKDQKEEFFNRRQVENASRPDHLPPSQGGKYSGFGYSREPPPKTQSQEIIDSTLSSLASGWSLLSAGASKFAGVAKEKAVTTVNIASAKIKEGGLLETVQSQVTEVASKVSDIGKRGWNNLAGSNISSPQGENSGYGYQDSSYQRSHSVSGNLGSGMGNQSGSGDNDWGWQDTPAQQPQQQQQYNMPSSKSYQNQFNLTSDDDWTGFESSNNNTNSFQNSSYQNQPSATNRNLRIQSTTQKLSEGFDDLDVKNVRPKTSSATAAPATTKTKSSTTKNAEDDAWNLLMN